ncbi:relaxase/mobilization nuclease domain-containing protein [Sphingomonas bacterium]|uniref:relaxase/mobilization nuclease domain-containing protein n=1 Tax=Sphingomonas bacterium TaxID=1895847 RepID=UPI001C2D9B2F|nr:relaxase/mobilization nuclease domain-containing protein [Sphingomonas bacterium]
MAGVFSPAKKYRLGAGGGKGRAPKSGGTMLAFAVASMLPKPTAAGGAYRAPAQTKRAFGGGNQVMVSRRAVATMERTARRVPEVMVRITGRQSGAGHVLANFSYISRLGHGTDKELGLHTSEGEVIRDGEEMRELAQEWHQYEMEGDARRKGATSLSMILSMPTGTDPEKVEAAALDFARTEFANRMWVASLHVDRDHPHVHLTIARRDDQGRRFNPNRDDLFRYRQRFAEKLRDRGIEANATPAKARGIDPKHEHIAARKVREKGEIPRLDRSRADRAERYRADSRADPVNPVLAEQRAMVLAAYERSIAELSASPSMVNQMVAKSLKRFIDEMPQPEPNSVRAARDRTSELGVGGRASTPEATAEAEALAAATIRLKAATERSRAILEARERDGDRPPERGGTRSPKSLDPSRTTSDQPDREPSAQPPDKIAEILRQVQERDRGHRDRERDRDHSPDRGGPRR